MIRNPDTRMSRERYGLLPGAVTGIATPVVWGNLGRSRRSEP